MSAKFHQASQCGKIVSIHPIGGMGLFYPVLAVLLVATAIALVFVAADAQMAVKEASLPVFLRITAGLLALLGLVIAARWHRLKGSSLTVFEKGIAHRRRGKTRFFRWRDVQDVTVRATKLPRLPIRRTWVKVSLAPKTTLKFTDNYQEVFALGINLLTLTAEAMVPLVIAKMERGGTVDFGALKVSRDGLSRRFGKLSWSEVDDAELRAGQVIIKKKGRRLPWGRPHAFQIKNLFVFLAVLEHFTQIDTGPAKVPQQMVALA
ncbi:DUF6585 family protein [Pseudoduganella sp. HUAS MS19]